MKFFPLKDIGQSKSTTIFLFTPTSSPSPDTLIQVKNPACDWEVPWILTNNYIVVPTVARLDLPVA